jgi:hypothetical protein
MLTGMDSPARGPVLMVLVDRVWLAAPITEATGPKSVTSADT